MPIIVLDTNVLVSAALSSNGKAAQCIKAITDGKATSVTCQEILDELEGKLRGKFYFSSDRIEQALDTIRGVSRIVEIAGNLKGVTTDPDDDKVVECAVVGEADHIVSGDKHLSKMGRYQKITVLKVAEFLNSVEHGE